MDITTSTKVCPYHVFGSVARDLAKVFDSFNHFFCKSVHICSFVPM